MTEEWRVQIWVSYLVMIRPMELTESSLSGEEWADVDGSYSEKMGDVATETAALRALKDAERFLDEAEALVDEDITLYGVDGM